jgi:hypothetical protein
MHVAREFKNLREAVAARSEASCREILEHLNALQVMMEKAKVMREEDPNYCLVLHQIGVHADAVLKIFRNAGIKGIKIPPAMHILRTSSRQADLTRQLAQQIVS